MFSHASLPFAFRLPAACPDTSSPGKVRVSCSFRASCEMCTQVRPDGRRRMLMRCDGMCSRQSADYCPRQVLFFVMHGISVFLTRKAASGRRGNGGISTMERFCALPYPRDKVGRTMTGAGGISARRRGGFPIMQEYPDRRLASLRTMGRKAVRRSCGRGAAA